ncbi:MAG: efflux RND transporter periplasmic adaptor subunit [Gemmatimonadota bacterium]|nr:efflux RND transporter periplasmic adaptor subunit [Gemmatimonadota bacterium]
MNRKTQITAAALVASVVGGALWVHQRADARSTRSYRLGKVEQGTIRSTVSATGTVNAVRTVEIGTQVSGQIAAVYVDYNSHVTKGQLIARIDPILQQQAVQDAQAGVARAEAPLTQTRLELERSKALHDQKIITDAEYNLAQSNYAVARANATSASISLQKARQNLAYTNIYSPIEGVVVERAMDVGQTVAASLASPKLFVIANDLSQMQILASVDESDIGKITPGQAVSFTVQSYPDQQFEGTVKQVRLNSTTVNNVVSYTAIVSASNPDGKLLPGMTATVKFVTGSASNVMTVPSGALRFTPAAVATTTVAAPSTTPRAPRGAGSGSRSASSKGTLWSVDAQGQLAKHVVTTGLTDGQRTQVQGDGLTAGMPIVIGASTAGAASAAGAAGAAGTTNPLQPSTARGGRGGPPGPF